MHRIDQKPLARAMRRFSALLMGLGMLFNHAIAQDNAATIERSPYAKWQNGVSPRADYFPIAVWLQSPQNAARYQKAGINLYVGLWRGPTEEQLAQLKRAGMKLICHQNEVGLNSADRDVIVGWMHGDEPDNAQSRRDGRGYDPPILPSKIVEDYERIQQKDPSRPILLNLGQGVAYDNWVGRGVRRNHPEDYAEYIRGADIVSFDIYPVVHDNAEVAGKLEFVPKGVQRLREWSDDQKIVWNCIECSRISNTKTKPTADQVRSEVWMSIIHGSRGLIYFVHQFQPTFVEASLLEDEELLRGVTQINQQVQRLAPVINSTKIVDVEVTSNARSDKTIVTLCKEMPDGIYLFAANMRNQNESATIRIPNPRVDKGEVLEENRTVTVSSGRFTDTFAPYAVHLYKLTARDSK